MANKSRMHNSAAELAAAAKDATDRKYVLRLYVSGDSSRSRRALESIQKICREQLHGRYDLEVIDLREHPVLAKDEQVFAAPMLIKQLPSPLRRLVGDMSDVEKVLLGLDLRPKRE